MEKKEELGKVKKLAIIGFFFISILGTILHFTYEFSDFNIIVGCFSAVNESVWEHLKIAVIPMVVWTYIEFIVLKYRQDNLWTSLINKIIALVLIVTIIFYLYTAILGKSVLVIDILLFYLSILVSQIIGYKKIKEKSVSVNKEEVNKYLTIIIFILFILFTFLPPKLDLFKDEITNTYGVFELKY